MRMPRMSLGQSIAIVAGLGLDLVILFRLVPLVERYHFAARLIVSTLVSANILCFGLFRLRTDRTAFFRGFVVFGLLATMVHLTWNFLLPNKMDDVYGLLLTPAQNLYSERLASYFSDSSFQQSVVSSYFSLVAVGISSLFALPQLLVAVIGGWAWRLIINRPVVASEWRNRI